MVLSSTLCQACPLEGKVRCTGCVKIGVTTRYCSQTCQQILWITHKDHCGKNNGLFFHPKPTEDEAMKCVRGILGQEASDNFETSYIEHLASNFSFKIIELLYNLPQIPTSQLYAKSTTVLCKNFVKQFFEINQTLSKELESANNFGIRNLATFLAVPRLDGSRYTNMPNLKPQFMEESPDEWFINCSDYNFLSLNLYTVLAHMRANMSKYPGGHFAEPATTHFVRLNKEADRLEIEGRMRFYEGSHLGLERSRFSIKWGETFADCHTCHVRTD